MLKIYDKYITYQLKKTRNMKIFHFWCIIEHIRAQYERQITEEKLERVEKKKSTFERKSSFLSPLFRFSGGLSGGA